MESHFERNAFENPTTRRIVDFLNCIGLTARRASIEVDTVLPGVLIEEGVLLIDESKLKYPGDLLHEAGHLATVTPQKRAQMGIDAGIRIHEEIGAIAWSWAALTHLELSPEIVFHSDGYKGDSESLIAAFLESRGPGIPLLSFYGMCSDPHAGSEAVPQDMPPFPHMTRWLREADDAG